MKCFHLTISAIDKHELVAGFPIWNQSPRPSIVVGRTYKVGDIFKEWEEFKGALIPVSDALIQSPGAVNLDRLIDCSVSQAGDSLMLDASEGENGNALVLINFTGYRELDAGNTVDASVVHDQDATLASAYFIDRAHSYLAIIANGGSIRFSYGKRKVVIHRIVGDAWYQWSYWFPYDVSTPIVEHTGLEISFDGETVRTKVLN